jgi:hypothetical protein
MSTVNAFTPKSKTYLVSTTTVQIPTTDNVYAVSYRIRNLSTNAAYFAWQPANPTGTAVVIGTVSAPTAGSPVDNVIGMFPESVEIFSLPPNVWLKSDTANAFEVLAGEGI